MNNAFFDLVQMAVGRRDSLSEPPASREEWEDLLKVTGKHNLLGVTFPVIDVLHDTLEIPLSVYSRWAMMAEKIAKRNEAQMKMCRSLYDKFLSDGFRSCLLKGQGAALRYPDPTLRQCGDIDIWLEGDRQAIVDYIRSLCPVKKIVYHHLDADLIPKMGVEVHFTPSWMNAPGANRRLQRWFSANAGEQFSGFNPRLGFCVPTTRFDAVYMLIHIYRHVLEEGVGLRQLLDYYYVLGQLTDADREKVREDLKFLKMQGFAASVMWVLGEVFQLDSRNMLVAPDASEGSFLLEEILRSGNFGRYDPRNAHAKGEGLVAHGKRKFGRGLRYFMHYPSEVFWMPFHMIWLYFWRRKHNYLYKGR
ncbi:MAG: nucleotidyltransferase family protein [Bacteroidales bacterium]|nr:nucleotidyltransferase family protein [Bacteroidales bacterium]